MIILFKLKDYVIFAKNCEILSAKAGKKVATNVIKKPSRALDVTANPATAAASRNPKNVLSTIPEIINRYHTGKGFYRNLFSFMLSKWCKETDRLYASAPFEKNNDSEERVEKK